MTILFNRCVSLQVDPIIFNIGKINSVFVNGVCFIRLQVAFVFPPSHPCFFKDSDFLINYPFIDGSLSILTRWFSRRCSTSSSFFILSISGRSNTSFVDHIFSSFQYLLIPVHLLIFYSSLFICFGVPKISQKIRVSTLHSFKIF